MLKYLLLLFPVIFFLLAVKNKEKLRKLKSTGRVPEIEAAHRNAGFFYFAAITSLAATVYWVIL